MSKTILKSNNLALALARDAFGNGISGNEERSLRYIMLVVEVLEAQTTVIESGGDTRAQQALNKLCSGASDEVDTWTPFSHERVAEKMAHFESLGLNSGSALSEVKPTDFGLDVAKYANGTSFSVSITPEPAAQTGV